MESKEIYRVSPAMRIRIFIARKMKFWPFVLWLCLIACVIWGMRYTNQVGSVGGVVEYPRYNVASNQTSRIDVVAVKSGDRVMEGDLLVELSSLEIDYEIAALKREKEREDRDTNRQLFNALLDVNRELRELTLAQSSKNAELETLREENLRLEALLERRLVDTETVSRNRMRLAGAEASVEKYPVLISELESEKKTLLEMSQSVSEEEESGGSELLAILEKRREMLDIRASRSGTVGQIDVRAGDVVRAGDPILEVVGQDAPLVRAFVPLSGQKIVSKGTLVYLENARQGEVIEGVIRSVDPAIVSIPDRSNPIMARSVKGRMFTVEMSESRNWTESAPLVVHFGDMKQSSFENWTANLSSWIRNDKAEN